MRGNDQEEAARRTLAARPERVGNYPYPGDFGAVWHPDAVWDWGEAGGESAFRRYQEAVDFWRRHRGSPHLAGVKLSDLQAPPPFTGEEWERLTWCPGTPRPFAPGERLDAARAAVAQREAHGRLPPLARNTAVRRDPEQEALTVVRLLEERGEPCDPEAIRRYCAEQAELLQALLDLADRRERAAQREEVVPTAATLGEVCSLDDVADATEAARAEAGG